MSAKFTLATHSIKQLPVHVIDAENGLSCNCVCDLCGGRLQSVQGKNTPKVSWYYRHDNKESKCPGSQETALHKYAKWLLCQNHFIETNSKRIYYTHPLQECITHKYRSDVKVQYQEEDLHFEVIVSHDLTPHKFNHYKVSRIKCIKIDLSDQALRKATPQQIEQAVLHDKRNKEFVYWANEKIPPSGKPSFSWLEFLKGGAAIALFSFLITRLLKKTRIHNKKRIKPRKRSQRSYRSKSIH